MKKTERPPCVACGSSRAKRQITASGYMCVDADKCYDRILKRRKAAQ